MGFLVIFLIFCIFWDFGHKKPDFLVIKWVFWDFGEKSVFLRRFLVVFLGKSVILGVFGCEKWWFYKGNRGFLMKFCVFCVFLIFFCFFLFWKRRGIWVFFFDKSDKNCVFLWNFGFLGCFLVLSNYDGVKNWLKMWLFDEKWCFFVKKWHILRQII